MYIGYMGDVTFVVSSHYMITPSEFQRSGESRWSEHDLILRKPVSQFKGPGLEKVTFKIQLRADHNITPSSQLKKLRQMRDTGAVFSETRNATISLLVLSSYVRKSPL